MFYNVLYDDVMAISHNADTVFICDFSIFSTQHGISDWIDEFKHNGFYNTIEDWPELVILRFNILSKSIIYGNFKDKHAIKVVLDFLSKSGFVYDGL